MRTLNPTPGRDTLCKLGCLALLILASTTQAIQFPDTAALNSEFRVAARRDGKPVEFFHKTDLDSVVLKLDWAGTAIVAFRIEKKLEFDPDSFSVLTTQLGAGGAWHEWDDPKAESAGRKAFPGLQQQWLLKGFGGEKGWLGSGLDRGRYFLVFSEHAPSQPKVAAGPLRLRRETLGYLDSSSQWLHVACLDSDLPDTAWDIDAEPIGKKGAAAGKTTQPAVRSKTRKNSAAAGTKLQKNSSGPTGTCFSPGDNAHWRIRVAGKSPLRLDIWLQEDESGSLQDIRKALESIPDNAQSEYARDLAQMLLGEAQMFLVKVAQKLPVLFTWPSWQLQDIQIGKISDTRFLELARGRQSVGEQLPALRFSEGPVQGRPGCRIDVDLYFSGRLHLYAEEKP